MQFEDPELNKTVKEIDKIINNMDDAILSIKSLGNKVYLNDPKAKDNWNKYFEGLIPAIEMKAKELRNLKENIELETLSN